MKVVTKHINLVVTRICTILSCINPAISYSMVGLILFRREYSVTLLMTKRIITNISEDRLLGGLFHELGEEIGWEILEMRQLLQFLKDF